MTCLLQNINFEHDNFHIQPQARKVEEKSGFFPVNRTFTMRGRLAHRIDTTIPWKFENRTGKRI